MEPSSLLELSSTIHLNSFARANFLHPLGVVLIALKVVAAVILVGAAKAYWMKFFYQRLTSDPE